MFRVFTGENRLLSGALLREIGAALAGEDAVQYIVVPKQLTLFTERLLLDGLKLRGSFRLRVLSPARLCTQIFEAAGMPEGVRVDERGRVMLVRRAIRAAEGLTIYKNALRRRGFAGRWRWCRSGRSGLRRWCLWRGSSSCACSSAPQIR